MDNYTHDDDPLALPTQPGPSHLHLETVAPFPSTSLSCRQTPQSHPPPLPSSSQTSFLSPPRPIRLLPRLPQPSVFSLAKSSKQPQLSREDQEMMDAFEWDLDPLSSASNAPQTVLRSATVTRTSAMNPASSSSPRHPSAKFSGEKIKTTNEVSNNVSLNYSAQFLIFSPENLADGCCGEDEEAGFMAEALVKRIINCLSHSIINTSPFVCEERGVCIKERAADRPL
ncbi:hypothetical protein T439DRAFT_331737 [Meredithblackwellia eburnea MCA 4105]